MSESKSMSTREKIGTTTRRLVKYFYENRSLVLSLDKIMEGVQSFISDAKKVLDLVFILDGIGMISRISKNKFIFLGLKDKLMQRMQLDMILENYREIQQKSLVNDMHNIFLTLAIGERNETNETIQYIGPEVLNYRKLSLDNLRANPAQNAAQFQTCIIDPQRKDQIYFTYLTREIDEKRASKKTQLFSQALLKELLVDSAQVELINKTINAITNKGISTNVTPGTNSNNSGSSNVAQISNNAVAGAIQQDSEEELADPKNEDNDETADVLEVPKAHISYFPKVAFALLKGRTWQFYMQKLQIIIGRSLVNPEQDKKASLGWHIDLEVGASKKVSRQHAVILYNFIKKRFEIKCLSKRLSIKVDNHLYSSKDEAVALKNKSLITVGNEHFYFFLPKSGSDEGMNIEDESVRKIRKEQEMEQELEEMEENLDEEEEEGNTDEEEGQEEEDDDNSPGQSEEQNNEELDEEDGDENEEEDQSLDQLEMNSTTLKKRKRNEEQEDQDEDEGEENNELEEELSHQSEDSSGNSNRDILDDDEKEFLKKTLHDVNEDEEDNDNEDDEEDNENQDEEEEDQDDNNDEEEG